MQLTIFYDSSCPLCLAEINQLKIHDAASQLHFVNINTDDFEEQYPYIDKSRANRILHGQLSTGEILLGLDVTCRAWSLVGKHTWLAVLRWPILRYLVDGFYLLFARYRYGISYLLTGQARCRDRCDLENDG